MVSEINKRWFHEILLDGDIRNVKIESKVLTVKYLRFQLVYLGVYQGFDHEILRIFVKPIAMVLPSKLQRNELVYF